MPKSGEFHTVQISKRIYDAISTQMARDSYVGTITGYIETILWREANGTSYSEVAGMVKAILEAVKKSEYLIPGEIQRQLDQRLGVQTRPNKVDEEHTPVAVRPKKRSAGESIEKAG